MDKTQQIKNANKLLNDIQKKRDKWNERSNFTIKGIKNLSISDLDTLELYAENFIKKGNFSGLMEPIGNILTIIETYGFGQI